MKRLNRQGNIHIIVSVAIVFMAVIGFAGWRIYRAQKQHSSANVQSSAGSNSQTQLSTVQTVVDPATKQELQLVSSTYYRLQISGGVEYYGKAAKINSMYLRLSDVAYMRNNVLTALGSEIHRPEQVMYISIANITSFQAIAPSDSFLTILDNFYKQIPPQTISDAFPSNNITNYLKTDRYQAVFLKGGNTYFTKIASLDGNFLVSNRPVFSLRSGSTTISLLIVNNADVQKYTAGDILFWENLKSDSQLAAAITSYNSTH